MQKIEKQEDKKLKKNSKKQKSKKKVKKQESRKVKKKGLLVTFGYFQLFWQLFGNFQVLLGTFGYKKVMDDE